MPHKHFIESYQRASIQVPEEQFRKHEETIDTFAEVANMQDAFAMVRAYLHKDLTPEDDSRLRDPFRKSDHTFPPRGASEQLRLLAGETLFQMTTLPGKASTTAAALALLANPDSADELYVVEHLRPAMVDYLQLEGNSVRSPLNFKTTKIPQFDRALLGRLSKVSDPVALAKEIPALAMFFSNLDGRLRTAQEQVIRSENHLKTIGEETNILWHLLRNTCALGYGSQVAKEHPKSISVVVAFELAQLTKLLPPPNSYQQLLKRELRGFGANLELAISPEEAFVDLPDSVRQSITGSSKYAEVVDLCPTLLNVQNTGGTSTISTTVQGLCIQLYTEFLLVKIADDDE